MTIIDDIISWEKKAKWPPNKKLFRRALIGLGHDDIWGLGYGMTWQEAKALYDSGTKKKYETIWPALKEAQEPDPNYKTMKQKAYEERQKAKTEKYAAVIIPDKQPSYKMSDVLFENKTLRRGMQDAQRENKRLIEAIGQNKPNDCKQQLEAFQFSDQMMRDALVAKDEEIARLKSQQGAADAYMTPVLKKKIIELEKDIESLMRQREGHDAKVDSLQRRLDTAQTRLDKLQNLEIEQDDWKITTHREISEHLEAEYKEQFLEMEKEIHELYDKLNKSNSEDVTFNEAMGALTLGRVLPPGKEDTLPLTSKEKELLLKFISECQYVQGEAQDIVHLVGSKKQPGPILKIRGVALDDYGHVITQDTKQYWHVMNLAYLDNLVSHAVQELQAAKLLCEKIKNSS